MFWCKLMNVQSDLNYLWVKQIELQGKLKFSSFKIYQLSWQSHPPSSLLPSWELESVTTGEHNYCIFTAYEMCPPYR